MSNTSLPPVFGEPPVKIIFEGVDTGSPAYKRLFIRHYGTIMRFHERARQSRMISEQPGSSMQQALPGGGLLQFTYNMGQETVRVRLNPVEVETETPEQPKVPYKPPVTPLLAIDVLFETDDFEVGDIFSFIPSTETVTVPGGPIGDQSNPNNWDFTGWDITWVGGARGVALANRVAAIQSEAGGAYFDSVLVNEQFLFLRDTPPPLYYPSQLPGLDYSLNPPTDTSVLWIIGIIQYTAGEGWRFGFGDDQEVVTVGIGGGGWSQDDWLGPRGPDVTETRNFKENHRERRKYVNVLSVVGVRVEADPDVQGDVAYEAISTGDFDDARLKPVMPADASKSIARTISISDPEQHGFVGHCFVAKPKVETPPGQEPAELEIEVWCATGNLRKYNTYPGQQGATFAADNPEMEYRAEEELCYRIRVREFSGAAVGVKVATDAEGKVEKFKAEKAEGTGAFPNDEDGEETVTSARHVDWAFAAGTKWVDGGGEPADPLAVDGDGISTMGKLLSETSVTCSQVQPVDIERSIPTTASWSGPVEDMTQIATIRWTPPKEEGKNGHADISLGGGGGGGEG